MFFQKASPVWAKGLREETNIAVGLCLAFELKAGQKATLRLAAHSVYRATLDGALVGYGPARGPKDKFRVDEIALMAKPGKNMLALEITAYNAENYAIACALPFVQAEIVVDGQAVTYTHSATPLFHLVERVQKAQRFSYQRPAMERYKLAQDYEDWKKGLACANAVPVETQEVEAVSLLPRGIAYGVFKRRDVKEIIGEGTFSAGDLPEKVWRDRSVTLEGLNLRGFLPGELEVISSDEMQTWKYDFASRQSCNMQLHTVKPGHFMLYDFGTNLSGMPGVKVKCEKPVRVVLSYDEILTDGDISLTRMSVTPLVDITLEPGVYDFEAREPYTFRYLKLQVFGEGEVEVEGVTLREYVYPYPIEVAFESGNEKLDLVFQAAVETFRQNAVDIYMDCPSRERAGWLCDSFFTARVEHALTGASYVERNFLENFLEADAFPHLPKGMVPMCYPADHVNGNFIPNWAMWWVIELEEYLARTNDEAMIKRVKPKVYELLGYFRPFINECGLLEKLEKWVFIEWSKAGEYTQDINFPTNMVYAGMLEVAGRLYEDAALVEQARLLKKAIRELSFDGTFFRDHAKRRVNGIEVMPDCTEACQYYAMFFDIATPASHPDFWQMMLEAFGPSRKETGAHEHVHPANAFIGNYLRLDVLSRYGLGEKLIHEMQDYFYFMAKRTGTLWENDTPTASCNHGFASHVAVWLIRHMPEAVKRV